MDLTGDLRADEGRAPGTVRNVKYRSHAWQDPQVHRVPAVVKSQLTGKR